MQGTTANLDAGGLRDIRTDSVGTRFANGIVMGLGLLNGTPSASLVPCGILRRGRDGIYCNFSFILLFKKVSSRVSQQSLYVETTYRALCVWSRPVALPAQNA